MDFLEDLFKGRHGNPHDHYHHSHHLGRDFIRSGMAHLFRSRTALIFLAVGLGLVLVLIIGVFILVLPLVYKCFSYVNQNGIKEIYELICLLSTDCGKAAGKVNYP
jgi:hypothetical protein